MSNHTLTDYSLVSCCYFGFSQVSIGPLPLAQAPRKGKAAQKDRTIRVPLALHQRLTRIGAEILAAKEKGQGYDDVPFTEQGARGVWVSHAAVIARALDELENKKARSNPRSTKPDNERKSKK